LRDSKDGMEINSPSVKFRTILIPSIMEQRTSYFYGSGYILYPYFLRYLQYDVMYSLTAIGFTLGGSSTVHIYAQTIHRTTHWNTIPRMEHI